MWDNTPTTPAWNEPRKKYIKTKTEVNDCLMQLLESVNEVMQTRTNAIINGSSIPEDIDPKLMHLEGWIEALKWVLHKHKRIPVYKNTISIKTINQQIAKEINEHSKR